MAPHLPLRLRALLIIPVLLFGAGCPSRQPVEQPAGPTAETAPAGDQAPLSVCSFNIKWLGHYTKKDDPALAELLGGYDVVLVQELVAPPENGTYPNGEEYEADDEAAEFFEAMESHGFEYVLSEEDTGANETIHSAGPGTEWWVAFYDPDSVRPDEALPSGYLADDRSDHPDYDRVPHAFPFECTGAGTDFVLISVHLAAGEDEADRRAGELSAIFSWIDRHDGQEGDFLVAGDMNIHDADELHAAEQAGFTALNDEKRPTNTNPNSPKAYDHLLFRSGTTHEVDRQFDFRVIDLIGSMEPLWNRPSPYPGDPYDGNLFAQYYSDHHPVVFQIVPGPDDD